LGAVPPAPTGTGSRSGGGAAATVVGPGGQGLSVGLLQGRASREEEIDILRFSSTFVSTSSFRHSRDGRLVAEQDKIPRCVGREFSEAFS